jgi:hypothetical protein
MIQATEDNPSAMSEVGCASRNRSRFFGRRSVDQEEATNGSVGVGQRRRVSGRDHFPAVLELLGARHDTFRPQIARPGGELFDALRHDARAQSIVARPGLNEEQVVASLDDGR